MQSISQKMLAPAQRNRLKEFSAEACVDIHCHCLPGLDDGPETMEQSLGLCRALVEDGITHSVATPHQMGRYVGTNSRAAILESIVALTEQLVRHEIPLTVEPGADVRIDECIPSLLDRAEIVTLIDTNTYILLELPSNTVIDPLPLIGQLNARGIQSIISHPERYEMIARKPQRVAPWLDAGAVLQITSASLIGEAGPEAFATAWQLLQAGAVSLVASDAHNTSERPPRMTQAIRSISAKLGHAVARRLCLENPRKVLSGQHIQSPRSFR